MKKTSYTRKESKWRLYHKIEDAERKRVFKIIPECAGFETFKTLYLFAHKAGSEKCPPEMKSAKIKKLSAVHSAFGNVKS